MAEKKINTQDIYWKSTYRSTVRRINDRLKTLSRELGTGSQIVQKYLTLIDEYNLPLTKSGYISKTPKEEHIIALNRIQKLPTYQKLLDYTKASLSPDERKILSHADIKERTKKRQVIGEKYNELMNTLPYNRVLDDDKIENIIYHKERKISYDEMQEVLDYFKDKDISGVDLFKGL